MLQLGLSILRVGDLRGDNIRVRVVFRGEGGAGPQSPVPHSLPVFLLLPTI